MFGSFKGQKRELIKIVYLSILKFYIKFSFKRLIGPKKELIKLGFN